MPQRSGKIWRNFANYTRQPLRIRLRSANPVGRGSTRSSLFSEAQPSVPDILIWTARGIAAFNVPLAFLLFWGSSMATGSRRAVASQFLGLILFMGAVAAAVTAFRVSGPIGTAPLMVLIAPAVAGLVLMPIGPPGETPVRDTLFVVAAFATPAILFAAAGRLP